jgi:hypothetical protein
MEVLGPEGMWKWSYSTLYTGKGREINVEGFYGNPEGKRSINLEINNSILLKWLLKKY